MEAPDILFIVLDTQRADRLGCYGYDRDTSPNLDRFAAGGTLFEQAVSPAQWTIPSHASMFTGLYPTTHGVTQSSQRLGHGLPHVAEVLQSAGYDTVGFCNNPLVGILDNDFRRGFDTFYNYGGAIPSLPRQEASGFAPANWVAEQYTHLLRKISYPIQNLFGQSDLAFRLSLNAWTTPLWSRLANFKGQNQRSVEDVVWYLEQRDRAPQAKPLFLFLNLMETHLPFWPPGEFIDQMAPYFRQSGEARSILRTWNREAYRWAAPLSEPLGELEAQVLNDLYDAEVAYQDNYLGALFDLLDARSLDRETMTVIVADHGDGLGEHNYFGHAFVAYEELVHVPLIVHWPGQYPAEARVESPVSTRRVFHTLLDAAGHAPATAEKVAAHPQVDDATIRFLSLRPTVAGEDPEQETAFAEVYPPMNFVRAIEQRQPELLETFRCLELRRAVVRREPGAEKTDRREPLKLIRTGETADELFNLHQDPAELVNLAEESPQTTLAMDELIELMVARTELERDQTADGAATEIDEDEELRQRLRGLGYME